MAKFKSIVRSTPSVIIALILGLLTALAAAARLRFGYPFRDLFEPTCIYIPDEEVLPTISFIIYRVVAGQPRNGSDDAITLDLNRQTPG